jgi:transposase-like protein
MVKIYCPDCKKERRVVSKLYSYICSKCSKTLGQRYTNMRIYVGDELIGSCKEGVIIK